MKLHAASFSDQFNIFFDEFGKHVEYEELETTGVNLENPVADIMIKSTELNGQDLTLNVSQTLATEMMLNNSDNTVCYDDLGCITRFSFADPNLWPINLLPESRNKIDTHFTLNTRDLTTPPARNHFVLYLVSFFRARKFIASFFFHVVVAAWSANFRLRYKWHYRSIFQSNSTNQVLYPRLAINWVRRALQS